MKAWHRYLVAFVLAVHGLVYFVFGAGKLSEPFQGWKGTSWLLGDAFTGERLKALSLALSRITGMAWLSCAVAIAFIRPPHGLWRPLAMTGAVFGVALFGVFWDGQTERAIQQGALGAVIGALVSLGAIAFPHLLD